jgi:hypothetical protein
MPSRCIFFFSALRAWSTLLSRTRTCTRRSSCCAFLVLRWRQPRSLCWMRGSPPIRRRSAIARASDFGSV